MAQKQNPTEEEVKYVGFFVSREHDPLEFDFLVKCKSLVKVSKDYWKVSHEDAARLGVHMRHVTTWDIGLESKEMSKEFKKIHTEGNFMVFNDKNKRTKFTCAPRKT